MHTTTTCDDDINRPNNNEGERVGDGNEEEEEVAGSNIDWKVQLEANKALGDTAFRKGEYETAIQHYSAALSLDPNHAVLLSNRSAAFLKNGQKSKALYDAQQIGDAMGVKGYSRLAAALQSLGRFGPAREEWERILSMDPTHVVALEGKKTCEVELAKQQQQQQPKNSDELAEGVADHNQPTSTNTDREDDLLDDFFNEVETVTKITQEEQTRMDEEKATDAIRNHRKDLGTVESQIARLLAPNYKWRNLNPFFVLDLTHNATAEDISRRYKALSLLLHPDKNIGQDRERVQEAYDQVLQAKAKLADEDKARHVRQLIAEGLRQGKKEWEQMQSKDEALLHDLQNKAVQKIFATAEYNRKQTDERLRNQEKRERQQEEEEKSKEQKQREFDLKWREENRVDNRVGNWRDFTKKRKKDS